MRVKYATVVAGILCVPVLAPAGGGTVEVKTVKYKELGDFVLKNRGKVMVVDFWTTGCIPCKEELPNLVAMYHKYPKDQFVAVAVNIDVPDDRAKPQTAEIRLRFLNKVKATFTNLLLDEPAETWQKLGIQTVPCVLVFDRQGHYYRFGGALEAPRNAKYKEIEPLVAELLKKK
jgi:thiol-disulfide isomerase/thioredoxin